MFVLGPQTIALLIVCPILAYFLATWLMKKDTEKEARRLAASKLAGSLQTYGLKRLPGLLQAYSVGDYTGMARQIQNFAELLQTDAKHINSEFDAVFTNVLDAKLATPEGQAFIVAKVAAIKGAVAAVAPVAPAVAS